MGSKKKAKRLRTQPVRVKKTQAQRYIEHLHSESYLKTLETRLRRYEKTKFDLERFKEEFMTDKEKERLKNAVASIKTTKQKISQIKNNPFKLGNPIYNKEYGNGIVTNLKFRGDKLLVEAIFLGYDQYDLPVEECAPYKDLTSAIFGE